MIPPVQTHRRVRGTRRGELRGSRTSRTSLAPGQDWQGCDADSEADQQGEVRGGKSDWSQR